MFSGFCLAFENPALVFIFKICKLTRDAGQKRTDAAPVDELEGFLQGDLLSV